MKDIKSKAMVKCIEYKMKESLCSVLAGLH